MQRQIGEVDKSMDRLNKPTMLWMAAVTQYFKVKCPHGHKDYGDTLMFCKRKEKESRGITKLIRIHPLGTGFMAIKPIVLELFHAGPSGAIKKRRISDAF